MTESTGQNEEVPDLVKAEAAGSWIWDLEVIEDRTERVEDSTQQEKREAGTYTDIDRVQDQEP